MKQKIKRDLKSLFLLVMMGIFSLATSHAQTGNPGAINGNIKDSQGEPIIGASVAVKGSAVGTVTDLDGNFQINASPNSTLVVTYIGFKQQEVPVEGKKNVSITLHDDNELLDEVVVIGYGSVKKSDLTGAISAIGEKDFAKGLTTSPTQLLTGKVPGVQITSNGGRAGAGSRIRVRGGASLNASNDPLIVIDGVPITSGLSGSSDALSMINPNDIESMNILKDASSTAIYGSRASNGVVLITTKKGTGSKMTINFTTNNSISVNSKKVDLINANQFRDLVNAYGTDNQKKMLGEANTDWQDEIYRTAFTTDNNISFRGAAKNLPYYVSLSYTNNNGILKEDNIQRSTLAINLTPSFFDKHLTLNLNLKGTIGKNRFGNGDAIGAALRMDPTQPVKGDGYGLFNGYWSWLANPSDITQGPSSLATKNPMALLMSKSDKSDTYRSIGNAQIDYKFHFLPELRANLNIGYDVAEGKGKVAVPEWAPQEYTTGGQKPVSEGGGFYPGGKRSQFEQKKRNLLFEYYMNYNKTFDAIKSNVDAVAGYGYQDWKTTDNAYDETTYNREKVLAVPQFAQVYFQNTLLSYFARLNYTLMDKYLLTATVRRDGSSRFSKENRWGTFPSFSAAWRLNEESFMKGFSALYNLKLRAGVGVTGQQEIDNYGYIATYSPSNTGAFYQFGDKTYSFWRPDGYDASRKWETTTTYNIGVDYGFFQNRLSGSIDYYSKRTKDLLNTVPLAIGENNTNEITKNIGSMKNQGVELSITGVPIETKDITWDLSFNATYNESEITKLTINDSDPNNDFVLLTGGISGGTGVRVQRHAVGYAPATFYLYKQLYNDKGNPIDGAYADLNGDGKIDEDDRYLSKSPEPKWYLGFNTNFRYKRVTMSTSLRSNLGNYVYNNIQSNAGSLAQTLQNDFLANGPSDLLYTKFTSQNLLSDYFLQNASFLKMDYLTFSYELPKFATWVSKATASFTIQNVFTITKYDGVDPEVTYTDVDKVYRGIDNNFYPNPRTFMLGINLNF